MITRDMPFDPANFDWWCDDCGASLNEQDGFNPYCGSWTCTECGCVNDIDEDEVVWSDDDDEERISVSDAADIWQSSGKDEDYMFGYTEEELEDAL